MVWTQVAPRRDQKNKDEANKEREENSESKTNPRRYAKRENGTMCVNRLYGNAQAEATTAAADSGPAG